MKKLLIIVLALAMVLSLAACGQKAAATETAATEAPAAEAADAAPAEEAAAAEETAAEATEEAVAAEEAAVTPDPTETYNQVISDYVKAINDQIPGTTLAQANMNTDIILLYAQENPLTKIGYYKHDIDGDGIDELFIGPVYNEEDHNKGLIYHLFTYDTENNTYKDLFVGKQTDKLYLCNDFTFVRAFAPADGITEYCTLDNSLNITSILQGENQTGANYDYTNKIFYTTNTTVWTQIQGDGGEGSIVSTITSDDAVSAIEAFNNNYMEIPYTPLSDF